MEAKVKEGFDRLKSGGGFLMFRRKFLSLGSGVLEDSEFKLWATLLGSANDFEGSNNGQLKVTVYQIQTYLKWSIGKSSQTLNQLIKKGFVRRNKNGHYFVAQNPEDVKDLLETFVQDGEKDVHANEQIIQQDEQISHDFLSYKDKGSY